MEKPDDYGGSNASNLYCKHCTDAQGNLLPRETVRQNMINFYNRTMGQAPEQAAAEVDKIMAKMPAWQGQVQPASPSVPSTQPASEPAMVETPAPEVPVEAPSLPVPPEQPAKPAEPVVGSATVPVETEETPTEQG